MFGRTLAHSLEHAKRALYHCANAGKTSHNNISILKNDSEMNDYSINSKFKGAFNVVNFIFLKKIKKYVFLKDQNDFSFLFLLSF